MQGLRASLRIEEFRALLVSYVINRAGDFVGSIALALIVLGSTGSVLATGARGYSAASRASARFHGASERSKAVALASK